MTDIDPRLSIGANNPPRDVLTEMREVHEHHMSKVERELLAAAATFKTGVKTDEEAGDLSDLLKKFRVHITDWERRQDETTRPVKALLGVMNNFFVLRIGRVQKPYTNLREIQRKYLSDKAAREAAKREAKVKAEREEAARLAREAEAKRQRAAELERQRQAEEAAARAAQEARDRAMREAEEAKARGDAEAAQTAQAEARAHRKVENKARSSARMATADAKAKREDASYTDQVAAMTEKNVVRLEQRAQAKPAEMSRVRGDLGSMTSLAQRWTHRIIDRKLLDPKEIMMFISKDELDTIVARAVHRGVRSMDGVEIFQTLEDRTK